MAAGAWVMSAAEYWQSLGIKHICYSGQSQGESKRGST